jgi:hypothetical protein
MARLGAGKTTVASLVANDFPQSAVVAGDALLDPNFLHPNLPGFAGTPSCVG